MFKHQPNQLNTRVFISLSNSKHQKLYVTSLATSIHLSTNASYLHILNSVEFIKVNTSSKEKLKLGESFYFYFHFTDQYLFYDHKEGSLSLSRNLDHRTLFKVVSNDSSSQGNIIKRSSNTEINAHRYQIILAEYSSKYLVQNSGQFLVAHLTDFNDELFQYSFVRFDESIYSFDNEYPLRLTAIETNLTLAYCNWRFVSKNKIGIFGSMFLIEFELGHEGKAAIKHVQSGSYLIVINNQINLAKNVNDDEKYIFTIFNYDQTGEYVLLRVNTIGGVKNIVTKNDHQLCTIGSDSLKNLMKKHYFSDQEIKNIAPFAWLKEEIDAPYDLDTILFIFEELQQLFQNFYDSYEREALRSLISEGLLETLQNSVKKYSWKKLGNKLTSIASLMLKVDPQILAQLFQVNYIYLNLIKNELFQCRAKSIILNSGEQSLNMLKNVSQLILSKNDLTQESLCTLTMVSSLIKKYHTTDNPNISSLYEITRNICDQSLTQINRKFITRKYLLGLQILLKHQSPQIISKKIYPAFNLEMITHEKSKMSESLQYIKMIDKQGPPVFYVVTDIPNFIEQLEVNIIAFPKILREFMHDMIEDIIPKNVRFETFESKVFSIVLCRTSLKYSWFNLDVFECKKLIKLLIQNIDNLENSGYKESGYGYFLIEAIESLKALISRYIYLVCQQNVKYDSLTFRIEDKINKCKQSIQQIGDIKVVLGKGLWSSFHNCSIASSLQPLSHLNNEEENGLTGQPGQMVENLILSFLQIGRDLSQKYDKQIENYIQHLKNIDDVCEQFSQLLSMFANKQYEYKWQSMAKLLIRCEDKISEAEYACIIMMIHKNNLYEYICSHSNDVCYRVLSQMIMMKQKGCGGQLDGVKILRYLFKSYEVLEDKWIKTDTQFGLLRNILYLIGGVISSEVYGIYQDYICMVPVQKWTLSYLRLCECFFSLNPQTYKVKLAMNYQERIFKRVGTDKMQIKLQNEKESFIISYLSLLTLLSNYHYNKLLVYEMIGDKALFNFLEGHFENLELKIMIIQFMVRTRIKKEYEYELFAGGQDLLWFKYGTNFLREQTQQSSKLKNKEFIFLKDYTYGMIDFLKMREDLLGFADLSENELLFIEGTNKLCAFQLSDLIQSTLNTEQITREIIEKIQWFENTYKINVNSLQFTHLLQENSPQPKLPDSYEFSYMLGVDTNLSQCVNLIEDKISLGTLVTLLLRLLSVLGMNANDESLPKLGLILQFLHYIVTHKSYEFIEKQISTLFLAMQEQMRLKNHTQVAMLQNIIRKSIWRNGKLNKRHQTSIQEMIMKNKDEFNEYFSEFLDKYTTFSPFYSTNYAYFNKKGEQSINWIVSEYICMLRFLICLSKSLNLRFKAVFAESQVFKKEIIVKISHILEKHWESSENPSKIRLTLITYELELINSLVLGPEEKNIAAISKYNYPSLIVKHLMSLQDYSTFTTPQEEQKHRIILKMKKTLAEIIFTLGRFWSYSTEETHLIESSLITYFRQTHKRFNMTDFDKIIVFYNKENRNQLAYMTFDLSLHLFYAIIQIYQKQSNQNINEIRSAYLQENNLVKSYNKRFKMFYQIYRLLAQLIIWAGKLAYQCCHRAANEMNLDEVSNFFEDFGTTHEEKLTTVIKYFCKHVSSIEIQIGDKIQTQYYLMLKEAKCYNPSIRKEFHRKIGLGNRQYRLSKFMELSTHIILRLEVEKEIKSFTQKYKPFDIIIKNRQLWKSMNFLCACLLNLLFFEEGIIEDPEVPENIMRSLSYLFCIFLFLIYFIQNLPLKRKIAAIYAKDEKRSKSRYFFSCIEIFNDKTLWFASIYFLILSLSFYELGFVALLMIDFFVRFKISKKVTEIVTRPIIQLFLIILLSVQVAFVYTCYLYFIQQPFDCPNTATCIQKSYQTYFGLNKNIFTPLQSTDITLKTVFIFFFAFFNIFVTMSLFIGVLLYEKKAKDIKAQDWQSQVRKKCFICDQQRSDIDRNRNNNKGFFEHIQEEHNLWSYMFYLVYLKNKEDENMSIIQNMVMEEWEKQTIQWFPTTYKEY